MLEGEKLIGAGAATIASAGAAIGIGNVLSSSIHSVAPVDGTAKMLELLSPVITPASFFIVLLLVIIFYLRRLLVLYAGTIKETREANIRAAKDWVQGQPLVIHEFTFSWLTGVRLQAKVYLPDSLRESGQAVPPTNEKE